MSIEAVYIPIIGWETDMAIRVTMQTSKPMRPKHGELKRYVRRNSWDDGYVWCEKQVGSPYDRAQGTCDASDLTPAIRAAADAQRGQAFGYVDWPR